MGKKRTKTGMIVNSRPHEAWPHHNVDDDVPARKRGQNQRDQRPDDGRPGELAVRSRSDI